MDRGTSARRFPIMVRMMARTQWLNRALGVTRWQKVVKVRLTLPNNSAIRSNTGNDVITNKFHFPGFLEDQLKGLLLLLKYLKYVLT
jgi:hypothetical protein